MKKSTAIFATGLTLAALSASVDARLYKWVDENGNVHYGDRLPASQVGKHHEELTNSGVRAKEHKRQKTQDELRAEVAAQAAEQKEEEIRKRKEAEQARKDQILMDTFTEERDIILMRDERLGAIDSNVQITQSYNQQLKEQLESTQSRIDRLEKGRRNVPDNLIKTLENLTTQLEKNMEFIENKKKERVLIEEQFDADLARFRELTSGAEQTTENDEEKRFSEKLKDQQNTQEAEEVPENDELPPEVAPAPTN